jgi:hypothetical protein
MARPVIESAIDSGTSSSLTGQVTINLGTNANRALWAQLVDPITGANTLTALTLDGVDILASVVGPTSMGGFNLYNVHHVTSLTGSKVLLATWANSGFKSVIAVAFSGADQTAPFSGRQTQYSASGANPLLTVASDANSLVVMGLQAAAGGTLTPGTSSSHIAGVAASFRYALQENGVASTTIDGTFGAQEFWASGASVAGTAGLTGSFTLDDFTFGGAFATGALSQLAGGITLDDFALSGVLGLVPGRVDTQPFKNWSGTLLPGVTVPNVVFLKLDRTLPLALINQVTAGDGVMTITNAALVTGTYYVMVSFDAAGTNIGAELVLAT